MPYNIPSINSQWPVRTQRRTMRDEVNKADSSAHVNLPHKPSDILKEKKLVKLGSTRQNHTSIFTY